MTIVRCAATAIGVFLLVADGAAAAERQMIVRYRIVYEQIAPPLPDGRRVRSENTALRLTVTDDRRMKIEAVLGSAKDKVATVYRRDGEVVDAGGYRATYRMPSKDVVVIRSDFPDFTLERTIRFGADACEASVTYGLKPGHATVTLAGPNGPTTSSDIRATGVNCRLITDAADEPATLEAGCAIHFDEESKHYAMRVSGGASCGSRTLGKSFENRTIRVAMPPSHGETRIQPPDILYVRYRPAPGYFGPDTFAIEIEGERDGERKRVRRIVDVDVVK
ncbi:hypothetical protein EYW49_15050 [Siculibacillus lacustris]|uniref:DUF3108 domain-containing protein n=1 Tax=Siculibacillus lacustris TaxID=1549641 RepID=A0A4Q9VKS9_9HYPH|nr:hypothetical protein [Siculibacillus lacustris]TBW35931.1 hypothetical protein EYW49_15050 [Siculibacillus lacustris]